MSIKSFKNQGLFTGVLDVEGFGVATFNAGLNADKQKSALLFDGNASIEDDVEVAVTCSFDGSNYKMDIDTGYDGKVFAIINKDRQSVQFTFDKTTEDVGGVQVAVQTPTPITNDSVSAEMRRLYTLGYI